MPELTQSELKKLIHFNPDAGTFTWIRRDGDSRAIKIFNAKFAGKEAGVTCPRGYRYVRFRAFGFFLVGRLAWLYVNGSWPAEEIDHINGDPSDNRIANIRAATRSENASNRGRHRNNKSGFKGVTKKREKWTACVRVRNVRYRLGTFNTAEEAYTAYAAKAKEVQAEFARI